MKTITIFIIPLLILSSCSVVKQNGYYQTKHYRIGKKHITKKSRLKSEKDSTTIYTKVTPITYKTSVNTGINAYPKLDKIPIKQIPENNGITASLPIKLKSKIVNHSIPNKLNVADSRHLHITPKPGFGEGKRKQKTGLLLIAAGILGFVIYASVYAELILLLALVCVVTGYLLIIQGSLLRAERGLNWLKASKILAIISFTSLLIFVITVSGFLGVIGGLSLIGSLVTLIIGLLLK